MPRDQERSTSHYPAERIESDEKQELFVRLLMQHERRVYGYILSLVPNWHDADEISQNTHVWLWKEFDSFEPGTNFAAWAIRVAHFHVLTWRKQVSRSKLVFNQEFIDLVGEEQVRGGSRLDDTHRALGDCINELSCRNRDLLAQCYAEGAVIKEVAKSQNRTIGSVYKTLQRVRLALHKCINRHLAIEEAT
ncbi:sigma-70 family RNA polymerase sigma factor [Adhaeretor mobilis]|uniref:ECF RNA polymerase sigma factor SigE n=1 Tax=Adhaeretor mobilis TaxID=1930276 RepID=A0A517MWF2_9BACT|nr:sigma-70 family RNA polymerase sigma factor [Adhaeretor mobilis]QDS99199.1 ECF RNA polymerase sigma factor SigE [Adhaeretor mobilis]